MHSPAWPPAVTRGVPPALALPPQLVESWKQGRGWSPARVRAMETPAHARTLAWNAPDALLSPGLCVRVSDRTVHSVQETTALTATLKGSLDTYYRETRNSLMAEGAMPHALVCIQPKSGDAACNMVRGFTARGKDVLEGKVTDACAGGRLPLGTLGEAGGICSSLPGCPSGLSLPRVHPHGSRHGTGS